MGRREGWDTSTSLELEHFLFCCSLPATITPESSRGERAVRERERRCAGAAPPRRPEGDPEGEPPSGAECVHMRVSRILTELSEHAAQGAASRAAVEPEDKRLGGGVRGALVVPVEEVLVTGRMWGEVCLGGCEWGGGGDWLGDVRGEGGEHEPCKTERGERGERRRALNVGACHSTVEQVQGEAGARGMSS